MREYVSKGGTIYIYMKWKEINERVLEEVLAAWSEGLDVHDRDLEEWALVAAEELNIPNFTAGHHWLLNFKGRNKIVDRKPRITGKIHRGATKEARDEFVQKVRSLLQRVPSRNVII